MVKFVFQSDITVKRPIRTLFVWFQSVSDYKHSWSKAVLHPCVYLILYTGTVSILYFIPLAPMTPLHLITFQHHQIGPNDTLAQIPPCYLLCLSLNLRPIIYSCDPLVWQWPSDSDRRDGHKFLQFDIVINYTSVTDGLIWVIGRHIHGLLDVAGQLPDLPKQMTDWLLC